MVARANYQLGNIFFYQQQYEQAEMYYRRFIEEVEKQEDSKQKKILVYSLVMELWEVCTSAWGIKKYLCNIISVRWIMQESIKWTCELPMQCIIWLLIIMNNKIYDEALAYLHESLKIKKKFNDKWTSISCYQMIAQVYLAQKEHRRAIRYLDSWISGGLQNSMQNQRSLNCMIFTQKYIAVLMNTRRPFNISKLTSH